MQVPDVADGYADSDSTLDMQHAFNMASAEYNAMRGGIDGSPSPAPRIRRDLKKPGADTPTSNLSAHLQRFDRNRRLSGGDGPLKGLFAKNGAAPTITETTSITNKKVGDSNIGKGSARHISDFRGVYSGGLGKVERNETSGKEMQGSGTPATKAGADVPVPSIEREPVNDNHRSPYNQSTFMSPEKNGDWDFDADFTAENLQISESPRITTGKANPSRSHQAGTPLRRAVNERLSQIRRREAEAAGTTFPEDTPVVKPKNDRLLEIKARETEALSKRAIASSLLDEIKMKNAEPRFKSPERRKHSTGVPQEEYPASGDAGRHNLFESGSKLRGELIQDTPIVVFKNSMDRKSDVDNQDRVRENGHRRATLSRSDSHDLLRRLAQATSLSPKGDSNGTENEQDALTTTKADIKQGPEARDNRTQLSQRERFRLEIKNPKDRPTVGFANLTRKPSSDSTEGKQPSKPTSEADPTERIANELSLFAPQDNYSEKGSMRAPSPVLSEPTNEETPRPPKVDPLTMPTPRITGAFVETPATVRVQKDDAFKAKVERELTELAQDQAESVKRPGPGPGPSSAPTGPRRSRSSSGRRRQLINTAKPPTVREDIMSILRANNIDDSTLENLDSLLADQETDQEIKQIVDETVRQVEDDLDKKFSDTSYREHELETYDRMSKSLQTGLLGIRSARKGIERLEGKVTLQGDKNEQAHPEVVPKAKPNSQSQSPPLLSGVAPVLISVPRLYTRTPKFKLTTFGLVTLCAMAWYALESAFCFLYAGPEYICTPSIPCDWSPNEPYFPYTMPFMLDEWATGGQGRALALRAGEEIGDIFADVSDWVTNTNLTQYDERYMDVWQRKRHRRRLRKHALNRKWTAPPGYQPRYPEQEAAKAARELAEELDEYDQTISADEIIW